MKKDKTSAKFGFCKPNLVNVVGGGGGWGRGEKLCTWRG